MPSPLAERRLAPFAHAYSGFISDAVLNSGAALTLFLTCANPLLRSFFFARAGSSPSGSTSLGDLIAK
jgi:hypothetical protein